MDERQLSLFWAMCPHLEPSTLRSLVRSFGSITALHSADSGDWAAASHSRSKTVQRMAAWRAGCSKHVDGLEESLRSRGISVIVLGDAAYPEQLLDLHDPPLVLFARGDTSTLRRPMRVAMVGTRRASSYGLEATRWIAGTVAACGGVVVSGMALGIDGAGHRAALDAHGSTIAVLGCGLDICYPPGHASLYREIADSGLALSEYSPAMQVAKHHFPERNRLIAALADVTVVVQAGEKSGALGTVERALELGRDVYAVPGPITSKMFRGSNQLLFDGAIPLVDPEQMMAIQFEGSR